MIVSIFQSFAGSGGCTFDFLVSEFDRSRRKLLRKQRQSGRSKGHWRTGMIVPMCENLRLMSGASEAAELATAWGGGCGGGPKGGLFRRSFFQKKE